LSTFFGKPARKHGLCGTRIVIFDLYKLANPFSGLAMAAPDRKPRSTGGAIRRFSLCVVSGDRTARDHLLQKLREPDSRDPSRLSKQLPCDAGNRFLAVRHRAGGGNRWTAQLPSICLLRRRSPQK
jgi:hypothetical protein